MLDARDGKTGRVRKKRDPRPQEDGIARWEICRLAGRELLDAFDVAGAVVRQPDALGQPRDDVERHDIDNRPALEDVRVSASEAE